MEANRNDVLQRYGRQMILSCVGVGGQQQILQGKVLLVGAGGIGSSAALYLASAGVPLTIMDHDTVDCSNLHRQVIHDTQNQGMNKALSAIQRLKLMNPNADYTAITEKLVPSNALKIIPNYDIVVDATDNFNVRYILNDACVLLKKTLVSGSAVGLEGQITVIIPYQTPCYRCLYPNPSPAESCRSCANAGILGPVAGLIGCLEAIETLKLLSNKQNQQTTTTSSISNSSKTHTIEGKQLFYDAKFGDFHSFELLKRNPLCVVCGESPQITNERDINDFISNLQELTNQAGLDYLGEKLKKDNELTCLEYSEKYSSRTFPFHFIIDVRSPHHFSLTHLQLDGSVVCPKLQEIQLSKDEMPKSVLINIPLAELQQQQSSNTEKDSENCSQPALQQFRRNYEEYKTKLNQEEIPVVVLCRRGIDGTIATRILLENNFPVCYNLVGGLTSWKETVDQNFPMY
jgi:adenylyltransferase/sulfurtransferase